MSAESLRIVMAWLVLAAGVWIFGYAIWVRMHYKVQALAVGLRRANAIQLGLVLIGGIVDLYMMLRAPFPSLDAVVFAMPSPSPILAIIVFCAGFALMVITHLFMGSSWRIGVPQGDGDIDALITSGPMRYSRNPIYVGIMAMLTGMTLAAPAPLTISVLILAFFGLTAIISEEEAYLQGQFGEEYGAYCRRVRRWL